MLATSELPPYLLVLQLLLRKKAAEELKKEQERKAAERRKIIDQRCGEPKNLEGTNEGRCLGARWPCVLAWDCWIGVVIDLGPTEACRVVGEPKNLEGTNEGRCVGARWLCVLAWDCWIGVVIDLGPTETCRVVRWIQAVNPRTSRVPMEVDAWGHGGRVSWLGTVEYKLSST